MKLDPTTTSANGRNQKTIQKPKASEVDAERALLEIHTTVWLNMVRKIWLEKEDKWKALRQL